jgi:hypothetical protein
VEIKEKYQVKLSIRFAALGYLDDDDDNDVVITRPWESIRETIKALSTENRS